MPPDQLWLHIRSSLECIVLKLIGDVALHMIYVLYEWGVKQVGRILVWFRSRFSSISIQYKKNTNYRGVYGWVQCTAHYYWCHMVPGLPLTFELKSPNNEQNVAKSSHFSSNFAEKVAALLFVAWLVIKIPNYVRPRGIRYKPWNLNYIDVFQSQSYHLLHHGSSVKEGMHPLAASLNASAW